MSSFLCRRAVHRDENDEASTLHTAVDQTLHPGVVACYEPEGRNDEPSDTMRGLCNPAHECFGTARFGSDATVACILRGNHLPDLKVSPASDVMTIAATAMFMMRRSNADAASVDGQALPPASQPEHADLKPRILQT